MSPYDPQAPDEDQWDSGWECPDWGEGYPGEAQGVTVYMAEFGMTPLEVQGPTTVRSNGSENFEWPEDFAGPEYWMALDRLQEESE